MSLGIISFGTLIEYFDFISFSIMYKHIPFVVAANPLIQFVLGYGFRLFGSIILLKFTKHTTPIKVLLYSIITISISTILIGLLPNSQNSFYLLIILRALQSLAFAVEFPTGASMFQEQKKTAFVVSFATQGYIIASFLCSLIFNILNQSQISSFGWRVPFLTGGIFGIILTLFRLKAFMGKKTDKVSSNNWIYTTNYLILSVALVYSIWSLLKQNIGFTPFAGHTLEKLNINDTRLFSLSGLLFIASLSILINLFMRANYLRTIAKSISYTILLKYAITHSIFQSYITSSAPALATINTISLIFSALFASIAHFKIWKFSIYDLPIALALIDFCGIPIIKFIYTQTLFNNTTSLLIIFILNQFFITSFMIKSFGYAKQLFEGKKYLISPAYNLTTFTSSYIFSKIEFLKASYLHQLFGSNLPLIISNSQVLGKLNLFFVNDLIRQSWLLPLLSMNLIKGALNYLC